MVAIFIVILIVGGFVGNSSFFATSRQELEKDIDKIRRSVRFARDEAILRGRIIRLQLDLDNTPQTMKVEFADETDFIIPSFMADPDSSEDEDEKELEKKKKNFDQAFTTVTEFTEGPLEFSENVVIRVIGSTLMNQVFNDGQISLFFYPSGEKDGGFFLLSTDEEMATVKYGPFTDEIDDEFIIIDDDIGDDQEAIESYFFAKGKELFNSWERE